MTDKNKATQSTQVIIGPARFSYLNYHEPKAAPGAPKAKYSVCLLIPKKDKDLKTRIDAAINAALIAKFGTKIPKGLKMPVRDGDEEKEDENYKGMWFINATSFDKPGMVDKDRKPILEKEEIYSGMYGYAAVNFYYFDASGNKGIACGLNNLMKLKDGENLTGRKKAEDEFADVDVSFDEDTDLD